MLIRGLVLAEQGQETDDPRVGRMSTADVDLALGALYSSVTQGEDLDMRAILDDLVSGALYQARHGAEQLYRRIGPRLETTRRRVRTREINRFARRGVSMIFY